MFQFKVFDWKKINVHIAIHSVRKIPMIQRYVNDRYINIFPTAKALISGENIYLSFIHLKICKLCYCIFLLNNQSNIVYKIKCTNITHLIINYMKLLNVLKCFLIFKIKLMIIYFFLNIIILLT